MFVVESHDNTGLFRSARNDALRDFAAIPSHDLQDPLRKIIVFGDRLRTTGTFNQQGEDYLSRMKKATQRMQQFIQDLLVYSKVSYKNDKPSY